MGSAQMRPAAHRTQVEMKIFMNLEAECLDRFRYPVVIQEYSREADTICSPYSSSTSRLQRLVCDTTRQLRDPPNDQKNSQKPVKYASLAGSFDIAPINQ